MKDDLEAAGSLVEELRYVTDRELIDDDIVGCAANANDVVIRSHDDPE